MSQQADILNSFCWILKHYDPIQVTIKCTYAYSNWQVKILTKVFNQEKD